MSIPNANCANGCQTKGLAILPVRYTVVPSYIKQPTPTWANLKSVTAQTLDAKYQYHVRILRQGFVYLYLPHLLLWQVYSVAPDGGLWLQPDVEMASILSEAPTCLSLHHDPIRTYFLCIPDADKCSVAWVAFSEHKWSKNTLDKYAAEPDKRMQRISPSLWSGKDESAVEGTPTTISQILDYAPTFDPTILPYDESSGVYVGLTNSGKVNAPKNRLTFNDVLSSEDEGQYTFDAQKLDQNSTSTPWVEGKKGLANIVSKKMQDHSHQSVPMILALNDAIGITHELNGYYNEVLARLVQYHQESEFEFNAQELLKQGEQLLIDDAGKEDFVGNVSQLAYVKDIMKTGRINPRYSQQKQQAYGLEALLKAKWFGKAGAGEVNRMFLGSSAGLGKYPSGHHYAASLRQRTKDDLSFYYDSSVSPEEHERWIKGIKNLDSQFTAETSLRFEQREAKGKAKWQKKYLSLLDTASLDKFNNQYQLLVKLINEKSKQRITQLINWIKSDNFIAVLQDYDKNNIIDIKDKKLGDIKALCVEGILCSNIIEKSIQGFEASEVGLQQLEKWTDLDAAFASEDYKDNILWRAVALNDDETLADIQEILAFIKERKNQGQSEVLDESAIDKVAENFKWKKLADFYKKSQAFVNGHNNLLLALKDNPDIIKTSMAKTGITYFLNNSVILKVSDYCMKGLLKNTLDPMSAVLFKAFNLTVTGTAKGAIFTYLHADYRYWQTVSTSTVKNKYWQHIAEANRWKSKMKYAWETIDKESDVLAKDRVASNSRAQRPGKDVRLSMLLVIFEVNNWLALEKTNPELANDPDFILKRDAARIALMAASADLMANYVKAIKGSNSVAFGRAKIFAGVFAGIAGFFAARLEQGNIVRSESKGHHGIANLYRLSTSLLVVNSALSIPTAITYHISFASSVLQKTLYKRIALRSVDRAAKIAVARTLALRVSLLAFGFWIGIAVLGIQLVIYLLENNELEDWCERCAFGKKRDQFYRVVDVDRIQSGRPYQIKYQQDKTIRLVQQDVGSPTTGPYTLYEYRRYGRFYERSATEQSKAFQDAIEKVLGIAGDSNEEEQVEYKLSLEEALALIEKQLGEIGKLA